MICRDRSPPVARSPAPSAARSPSNSSTSAAALPASTRWCRSTPTRKARRTSPSTRWSVCSARRRSRSSTAFIPARMRCRSPPRSRRKRKSSGLPRRWRRRCSRTRTCNTSSAPKFISENAKGKLGKEPSDVKVAIIHEDGPYGVGVAEAGERFAKELGLQVVMREGYSAAAPDLSSLVTKLKRAGADVISHAGYNPDITLFLRQSRESGLRFKMLVGDGAGYSQLDKLRATFGADIDNFCNIDPVPAQLIKAESLAPGLGDLTKIMVERYKAKTQ